MEATRGTSSSLLSELDSLDSSLDSLDSLELCLDIRGLGLSTAVMALVLLPLLLSVLLSVEMGVLTTLFLRSRTAVLMGRTAAATFPFNSSLLARFLTGGVFSLSSLIPELPLTTTP